MDRASEGRPGAIGPRLSSHLRDAAHLASGTPRQRRAHAALGEVGVLRDLARFDATLIGTVPLGVDLPDSDLDIACRALDAVEFAAELRRLYGAMSGFDIRAAEVSLPAPGRAIVASFAHGGERYEVFGEARAVEEQAGFRHMVVEARLLELAGPSLRDHVRRLRMGGARTEPAFASALGLDGDPYRRMLDLFDAGDDDLRALVRHAAG
jgi:hypothetical protein